MADDFADSIADQVRSLELSQLLAVCDQFNVDVPAEKKETRGAVVRLFNKLVNEKVEADAEDELRQIDGEIGKMLKIKLKTDDKVLEQKEAATSNSVVTDGVKSDGQKVPLDGKRVPLSVPGAAAAGGSSDLVQQKVELLRGLRGREFKIDGAVGRGAGCIDWQNLQFQIRKGKTAQYSSDEIKNGVIKARIQHASLLPECRRD